MKIDGYEIDEEKVVEWVRENNLRRVLIQAPDGMKKTALALTGYLESIGVEAFLSASHAWGGCDVAFDEAVKVSAEGIIHIGHHGPVWFKIPSQLPVLFVPAYSTVDPLPAFSHLLDKLEREGVKSIALLTTVQHVKWIPLLKEAAQRRNIQPFTGSFSGFEGLAVGCNYSSIPPVEVEAIVVVAGGVFHAIGAAIWSGKPVWCLDPYIKSFRKVDLKGVLSRRLYMLSKALDASTFLIVVSTKPGQKRLEAALNAKKALEKKSRMARIAVFDEIDREKLENLGVFDAYLNTACPRLVIDDPDIFPGPSLNLGELKYVFKGSLEGYSLRDSLLLDLRFLEGP